jgi:diadenylate cyclase
VVTGDLLIAAACILPLSQNPRLGQWLGTRHRAAVGVTEETDALALVVSEETGRISIAEAGKLKTGLDQASLKAELAKVFSGS